LPNLAENIRKVVGLTLKCEGEDEEESDIAFINEATWGLCYLLKKLAVSNNKVSVFLSLEEVLAYVYSST
jgi:hypothetical protein